MKPCSWDLFALEKSDTGRYQQVMARGSNLDRCLFLHSLQRVVFLFVSGWEERGNTL